MTTVTASAKRGRRTLPGAGWLVAGVVIAVLVAPTAAYGVLAYTGIEGTQGSGATLFRAGVASTHQLQVASAAPSSYFSSWTARTGLFSQRQRGRDCPWTFDSVLTSTRTWPWTFWTADGV